MTRIYEYVLLTKLAIEEERLRLTHYKRNEIAWVV